MTRVSGGAVDLEKLVLSLSYALDLAHPKLFKHSGRVAHLASSIGRELDLGQENEKNLYLASLIHDAGISSSDFKSETLQFDLGEKARQHSIDGYHLFKDFAPLSNAASIILHHHDYWEQLGIQERERLTPHFLGNIIHLADRVEVSINRNQPVLQQVEKITGLINKYVPTYFAPEIASVFNELAKKESFWLELEFGSDAVETREVGSVDRLLLSYEEIKQLALIFAEIIDRKSPFTRTHSQGIARMATKIAGAFGFSQHECLQMEIAGLLHDLGKLSIPDHILEKPGALDEQEKLLMKQHTFYTYHLLGKIDAFHTVKEWAAFHHEKLNGEGYPFGLEAAEISLGARIMAVSDIYQALREDRPYRKAMPKEKAFAILDQMVADNHLAGNVVEKLKEIA